MRTLSRRRGAWKSARQAARRLARAAVTPSGTPGGTLRGGLAGTLGGVLVAALASTASLAHAAPAGGHAPRVGSPASPVLQVLQEESGAAAGTGAAGAARRGAPRELVVLTEEVTFGAWPHLEALAAEFEAAHPGVRVRLLDQGGAAGAKDKVRFLLAGDLPLDVARIDVTELPAFRGEGALVDLEPYFAADETWDATAYFAAPLDALRDERGHLWGLPSTFTPYVMYANRDLLAREGIAWPREGWTWSELVAACRRATRDTDGDGRIDQWGISLTQWLQALAPWVWQNGGRLLAAGGERAAFAEPATVEAFAFVRGLLHGERVASFDASFEDQFRQGLFQAGRTAFYGPVGYWETYRFRHLDAFAWDVLPLPRGREAATSVAMTVFVVPRTSRHRELAYRFVRALAAEPFQRMYAEIGNGVPGLVAAARSESFLKPDVPPESEEVFLDAMASARFLPPSVNWVAIESLCAAELARILLADECDVAASCARMAERTDRHLARERSRRERPRLPAGTLELCFGAAIVATLALFARLRGRGGARLAGPGARLARRDERAALGLLAPWAAGILLLVAGPAAVSLLLALCEWSPLRDLADTRWVGTENLARLAADGTFHTSLGATALYVALSVPLTTVVALAIALLLVAEGTLASLVRTLVYVPAVISPVVVGSVWRQLLDPERGPLSAAVRAVGLDPPAWLRDPDWVVPSFVLVSLWSVGAQMLVFLAGLKGLDRTLVEAARIDGAGWWRRLVHVVLPGLSPVILFNLLTGTVAAAQVFAQPYVMTQGGPGDASRFLVLYLYESGFRNFEMGYASAIAWALFCGLALACALLLLASRRFVHYAGGGRRPA